MGRAGRMRGSRTVWVHLSVAKLFHYWRLQMRKTAITEEEEEPIYNSLYVP
jgi:hypothetical protein